MRSVIVVTALVTVMALFGCSGRSEPAQTEDTTAAPTTAPSPEATEPAIAPEVRSQVESLANDGAQLYNRITKRYPNTELYLGGGLDNRVWLEFAVPHEAWSNLKPRERVHFVLHRRPDPSRS